MNPRLASRSTEEFEFQLVLVGRGLDFLSYFVIAFRDLGKEGKLRAEMPEHRHPALTFCCETGCRIGAMNQVIWPWVNIANQEISFPPGIFKNRKPLIVPLFNELVAMLKNEFQGIAPVFEIEHLRREKIKACIKCGSGYRPIKPDTKGKAWSLPISVVLPSVLFGISVPFGTAKPVKALEIW